MTPLELRQLAEKCRRTARRASPELAVELLQWALNFDDRARAKTSDAGDDGISGDED
jgi:hypothetical protein